MSEMILVEKHEFSYQSDIAKSLRDSFFFSKNLYNISLYLCRQNFIKNHYGLNYNILYKQIMENETYRNDYKKLPAKVAQQTIMNASLTFKGFVAALKDYYKNPDKYLAKPKMPRYKHKTSGKYTLTYTKQAISKKELKNGILLLSGTDIKIKTQIEKRDTIQQVRVIPFASVIKIEVVYSKTKVNRNLSTENIIGIDLGVNNLLAITSNKIGFHPILVNGRIIKSINQFYNKMKASYQSLLDKDRKTSNRINRLGHKRANKINHYFHHVSKMIIETCIRENIGTIVIGKNVDWKQGVNMRKSTNQTFVSIPYNVLISQIRYKGELNGIEVIETEESYTSKCSFLDLEDICKHEIYSGRRISRGLFRNSIGRKISSDINGSYNIIRKVFPNSFREGIEGVVVHPSFVTLCRA